MNHDPLSPTNGDWVYQHKDAEMANLLTAAWGDGTYNLAGYIR